MEGRRREAAGKRRERRPRVGVGSGRVGGVRVCACKARPLPRSLRARLP